VAITFIVDQVDDEPDILTSIAHQNLRILTTAGAALLEVPAPNSGWTQSTLEYATRDITGLPLDAYLGNSWVGSTEV
tara:strand:+ start:249 stop:479 length:231 start_codon:yes stop_codon:yes gene_type:complete